MMTGVQLRPARVSDAVGWGEQVKAVADEGRWIATEGDRTAEEIAGRFRSAIADGHILFVLEEADRIVGGIGIHPTDVGGVHTLGMSILSEFRGQGWGRQLVTAGIEEARARGIVKVVLAARR